MITLYLMRHGQSEFNKAQIMQGSTNSNLSEDGIQQAIDARELINTLNFHNVYTGSLTRQIDTARIACKEKKNITFRLNEGFNEVNFGGFEKKPIAFLVETIAKGSNIDNPANVQVTCELVANSCAKFDPEQRAEDYKTAAARVRKAVYEVIERCSENEKVLIVSSGMILEILLREFVPDLGVTNIGNCKVFALHYDDGKFYGETL